MTQPDRRHPDRGYCYERTQNDPLELELASTWERRAPASLPEIIGRRPTLSDRWTAASLVQWLGTPVGFSFIQQCFLKCGYTLVHPRATPWVVHLEPIVAEIIRARFMDEGVREAHQLLFDMCEPN